VCTAQQIVYQCCAAPSAASGVAKNINIFFAIASVRHNRGVSSLADNRSVREKRKLGVNLIVIVGVKESECRLIRIHATRSAVCGGWRVFHN
jgi:hypothetical protein